MLDFNERTSGQVPLEDDTPVLDDTPFSSDYGCGVLPGEFAVVGVRSEIGDDYDLEVYTDTTYTTLIDSSNTVGDAVDFVVLDKDAWTSPPDRGVKVTSGSSDYVIEMENQMESHPVFDSWSGSMNRSAGNPVLDLGPSGSFDDEFAYFPCVIDDGSIYHMWYSGFDGSNVRIGYANSTDGINWTKYSGNPIFDLGAPGSWEDYHVHYPMVLWNGTGYEMWYSGFTGTNYRIGYATSPDGLSWTKYGGNPVVPLGGVGSFDEQYAGQASVLLEGGTYHMWYSGIDSGGEGRTGYATSPDGVSWTKYPGNPVLDLGPPGSWDDFRAYVPSVVFNGTKYFMMYSGNDGSTYRIGYASSTDKINWTKSPANPVLDLGPGGSWDDTNVGTPYILYDGTTYKMWYSGFDGTNNRVGYATLSNMFNFEKYSGNPVIDIGSPGSWNDMYTYAPSVLHDGTTYHMWYGGHDGSNVRIGYANSTDGVSWVIYSGNPVLDLGLSGSWDDQHVHYPYVFYDGAIYHMWYSGKDGLNHRIGYANSTDGITWSKFSGNPVLDIGSSGSWDDEFVFSPEVIFDGSTYHMWYSGYDGSKRRTGYATSPDRVTWTKSGANPVLDVSPDGSWDDDYTCIPRIVYDGTTYHMWYTGYDGSTYRIGYATSNDGIAWVKSPSNPFLDFGPSGSWDDRHLLYQDMFYDGMGFHMWYSGGDGTNIRIGYVRNVWEKLESVTEVLDAYEISGITLGAGYTIALDVPPTSDLDMFIYDTTGGRNDAVTFSTNSGAGIDESITFIAPTTGSYLLVITNEDGGAGTYTISFIGTPPVITNVTAIPDPQEVYRAVNISANITDDIGLFGTWVEIYDPLGGFIGNMTMQYDPINGKYYWIQTYDLLGTYTFIIYVNDTNDFWSSSSGSFVIQDTTPPIIIDVNAIPDPQEVFGVVNISANVTDNYQLYDVWLELYDPTNAFISNLSMLYNSLNNRYYWNLTYDLLGTYNFTIWANDTSNNWAEYTSTFVIQDTTPPVILNVTAIPNPQEVYYEVNISANITDNFQLYEVWVQIFDPFGVYVGNFSMIYDSANLRYYTNQTYDILGTYSFTIWANDSSDNLASYTGSFVIHDTTPPVIANVTAIPNPQEVFGTVNISANVTDNFKLYGAWVEIEDPFGNPAGNLSLLNTSINDRYFCIRTYTEIGQYTYTIWANDTSNNWASFLGSFAIQDTTSPIILDVTALPNPQEVFGSVRISADISDNYQLEGEWVEIFDPKGKFVGNFSMSYDTSEGKFFYLRSYDLLGEYTFTIWAKDTSDNWDSASDTFIIQDTTPPVISDVTVIPNPQEVFDSVNISGVITDNYQLSGVWIEIYDSDGGFIGNISMSYSLSDGRYYTTQPHDLLDIYSYTIWANDTSDNWAYISGTYEIQDSTPPAILNTTAIPDPQEVFNSVRIEANVTDNYELSSVWIEIYDPQDEQLGTFIMEYDSLGLKYYWNQTYNIIGTYSYIIKANDTSHNLNSVSGSFLIQDTTPPVITARIIVITLQNGYDNVNISANVTDNYQLDDVWITISNSEGILIGNYSLLYDSIRGKFYIKNTYNISGEYSYTIWANDTSGNRASSSGSFEIEPDEEPDEYNWKPIIALIFMAILLIVGIIVVYNRPMKFTGDLSKDRTYTFLAGVLPFAIAEAITGIISFVTGLLAVPPLLGLGMIVDLAILIVGIICSIVIYKKGVPYDTYVKEDEPPESSAIPPPSNDAQPEESEETITSEEDPPPISPPETPPSSPLPPPEENPPMPPTSPPEESPPSTPSPQSP
jgi:predicted GH43/DUF377 family glycosyl hydrolase